MPTRVGFKCRACTGAPSAPSARRGRDTGRLTGSRRNVGVAAAAGVVLVGVVVFGLVSGAGTDGAGDPVTLGEDGDDAAAGDLHVEVTGAGRLTLGANLLMPAGSGPPVPAVVVIPGFGPTDRNGIAAPGQPPDALYRDVAEALAEAGVASLRYDKRRQGESVLPAGTPLRFPDLVEDARGALDFLAERKGVDGRRLAVVGHDEGGLIALRLAAHDPRVRAVALISTPGRPLAEVLADDLRAAATTREEGEALAARLRDVAARVAGGGAVPPAEELPGPLRAVFPADDEEYLRELFSVDPAADAGRVEVPTLVVRGGRDSGVSIADEQALVAALGPSTEVVVGAEAGHTLLVSSAAQAAEPRPEEHDESVHEGPAAAVSERDESLLGRLGAWLAGNLGNETPGELSLSGEEFRFSPASLHVRPGAYRIVVTNDGAVEHQLLVHRPEAHDRPVAEIASVPPGESRSVTVTLEDGTYDYACHLPGHFEAGMRGRIRVGG